MFGHSRGHSTWRHVATHVVWWGTAIWGISGDGWFIFLTAYLSVWVMTPPPPWDPVGTGNFWPVLAACPLPQARLRQQHFRECLSAGGESEKETNSRGLRKLRQAWEWLEWKGASCSREFAADVQIFLVLPNAMHHVKWTERNWEFFSYFSRKKLWFLNGRKTLSQYTTLAFFSKCTYIWTSSVKLQNETKVVNAFTLYILFYD